MNLDLQAAMHDQQITQIVLNINSGGGYVAGVHEFATKIANATKPTAAYIFGTGASAAYWIAAAADQVVIDATAQAGSIGVVATYFDWTKFDERVGIKEIEIINSDSPLKRIDVTTEEGQALIRQQLDEMAGVFFEDVSRGRGISTSEVTDLKGNVFVGQRTVEVGLADRTGSLESLIDDASITNTGTTSSLTDPIADPGSVQPEPSTEVLHTPPAAEMTKADIKARYPEIIAEIEREAITQAAETEAERVLGLMSMKTHGCPKAEQLVEAALLDTTKTDMSIAKEVLSEVSAYFDKSQALADIQSDAPLGVPDLPENDEAGELDALIEHGVASVNRGPGRRQQRGSGES